MISMSSGKDHTGGFLRFSRPRLLARRRHVGFQSLVFTQPSFICNSCHRCGRSFVNNKWTGFLCHCCGFLFCAKCSEVIERERVELRIEFVRLCCECLKMVNKWSDTEMLLSYAISPWVVRSSTCQLALNLVDHYQTKGEHFHPSVIEFLDLFNNCDMKRPVDPSSTDVLSAYHQSIGGGTLDDSELAALDELSNTLGRSPSADSSSVLERSSSGSNVPQFSHGLDAVLEEDLPHPRTGRGKVSMSKELFRETSVRFLQISPVLQQCFEVSVKEIPLNQCIFAEQDGTRMYPLVYDSGTEIPELPHDFFIEKSRFKHLAQYKLLENERRNLEIMAEGLDLYCELAAKELNASTAFVAIASNESQFILATNHSRKSSWLHAVTPFAIGDTFGNNNSNSNGNDMDAATNKDLSTERSSTFERFIGRINESELDNEDDNYSSANGGNRAGNNIINDNVTGSSTLFGNFEMFSSWPFLIRHAALDVRFRNFEMVRSGHVGFFLSVPIQCKNIEEPGGKLITLATLCVTDQKPRKHITTMQYTVMRLLASLIMQLWDRRHASSPQTGIGGRHNFH